MATKKAVTERALLRVLEHLTSGSPESLSGEKRDAVKRLRGALHDRNVVGVGVAEKVRKRKGTGKLALVFYVSEKKPLARLQASLAVPPAVPEAIASGVALATDVVVIGKLRPEKPRVTRKEIAPGYSIGQAFESAGTLGAMVKKGKTLHVLSNSHVLARSGRGRKGDPIIYPGLEDGGEKPADVIGKLSGFAKFKAGSTYQNRVDCAIASVLPAWKPKVNAEISGVGLPRGVLVAKRGMKIVKVGRTSGKTTGVVKDVNFRFVLDYENVGSVGFADQVLCTRYSKPGDSGALVLDSKTKKAVGLHFAGAEGGSVFCPIGEVLRVLKIKLVTKGG